MAALADLSVNQEVAVVGTVVKIDPIDPHFQGVYVQLSDPDTPATDPLYHKVIRVDPVEVDASSLSLLARYEAALTLLGLTLLQVETASHIDTPGSTSGHIIADVTLAV
jgi:hypothetical protein